MNVVLNFTGIRCELGHENSYCNRKCKVCGEVFDEFIDEVDPEVQKRRDFMNPYISIIENKKESITKNLDVFTQTEDIFDGIEEAYYKIGKLLSQLNAEVSKEFFEDIEINSNNLHDEELINEIEEFIHSILMMMELSELSKNLKCIMIDKNKNNKLHDIIEKYLLFYIKMIDGIVAEDLDSAHEIQDSISLNIKMLEFDLDILNQIYDNENLDEQVDMFDANTFNQSLLYSKIFKTDAGSPMKNLERTGEITHYYFKDFLTTNYKDIKLEHLLTLSIYRCLGVTNFDDELFLKKMKVVLDLLESSYQIDEKSMENCIDEYMNTYLFMSSKFSDIASNFAFLLSNSPPEKILIDNSMTWYKNLSEGIYTDVIRILYYSKSIIEGEVVPPEDALVGIQFGQLFNVFNSSKKNKYRLLTDGVVTYLRNTEAHATYSIDEINRKIIARNKKRDCNDVIVREHSFEEFFEIFNRLLETIFSIIAGFHIFLINNDLAFKKNLEIIEQSGDANENKLDMMLSMNGYVIISRKEYNVDGQSVLEIEIYSIEEPDVEDYDIKFNSIAQVLLMNGIKYDFFYFNIVNNEKGLIDKVCLSTKYFQLNIKEESFDDYIYMALNVFLGKHLFNLDASKDDINNLCIKVVHNLMGVIRNNFLNCSEYYKDSNVQDFKQCLSKVIGEVDKLIWMVDEYVLIIGQCNKVIHLCELLKLYKLTFLYLMQEDIDDDYFRENIYRIQKFANLSVYFADYLKGKKLLSDYFDYYVNEIYSISHKLKVNESCPCGSRKKYKKCCRR